MSGLLAIDGLSCRFGSIQALRGVSTAIEAGEIRGLIGPNGAGKTTLVNVLTGFVRSDEGRVLLDGVPLGRMPAHARVRRGLARTFQTSQLCEELPVVTNIAVGACSRLATARLRLLFDGSRQRLRDVRRDAARVAERVGLGDVGHVEAGALSYGQRRLLEIGRALMTRPRVLFLDEPVAGMNALESGEVAALVRRLRDDGITLVVIEHDMPFVMGLVDRVTVLSSGELLAEGAPGEVQRDPAVETAYLGAGRADA
jgi:ABC-type branched-subunit amino acid transport system ATPase component